MVDQKLLMNRIPAAEEQGVHEVVPYRAGRNVPDRAPMGSHCHISRVIMRAEAINKGFSPGEWGYTGQPVFKGFGI